jgi:hypothetical protein
MHFKLKYSLILISVILLVSLLIKPTLAALPNNPYYFNGNVGIGVTAPNSSLDIIRPASTNLLTSGIRVNRPDGYGSYAFMSYGTSSRTAYFGSVYGGGAKGDLVFRTSDGNNNLDALYINGTSGNVGIGNVNPLVKLAVNGDVALYGGRITTNSTDGYYISLSSGPGTWGPSTNTYDGLKTNDLAITFSAGGLQSAYMDQNGGWHATSSKAKKENFQGLALNQILDNIDNLPIMRWNYKGEDSSIQHIGPFAEDFHDLFQLSGADNQTINYTDGIGVSLAGVKALSTQFKELKDKNAVLEQRLKALEEKLDQLAK